MAKPLQAQVRGTLETGTLSTSSTRTSTSSSSSSSSTTSNPFSNDSTFRDTNEVKGLVYHKEIPDSVLQKQVYMFRYVPLKVKIDEVWNPALDPTGVQFGDRLDALNGNYYLGKGTVGQPHYALFPTLTDGLSTQLQPDPNIGYAKRRTNIWLYQTMTPYTELRYHSSLDKDYQVSISHTQNIRPGWNIAFDYDLICPEGVYTSSGVKNHYLDAVTNYFSPDSRLQATAGIIWQGLNIDENGGISSDSYFTASANRAGVPVNLYNSGTTHRESELFGRASYNMVQQVEQYRYRDSLVARVINDTLTVMDTVQIIDTIPVGTPHVLNAGVVALELGYERRKRVFADSTLWNMFSANLYWTNDAYPDYRWRNPLKVTLGATIEQVRAVISVDTLRHFNVYPFANAAVALDRSTLRGEAKVQAGRDADYYLAATYELPFDSAGTTVLSASAATQRQSMDERYLYDALVGQLLTLRPQSAQRYEVGLRSGEWLDLMVRANHLSHNTWYDTTLRVHEGDSPFWLYQAALTARLHAGWLHLDMQQLVQHSTDAEQMPVPLWATKNSLYADLHLFNRVLHMQVGVDVRYHTPFLSPTYNYRTGLFVHQDESEVGGYLWGDVFVNIQVKRASAYIKAGHLNALWESNPTYFLLPHYPGRKFGIYWGITWKFFD